MLKKILSGLDYFFYSCVGFFIGFMSVILLFLMGYEIIYGNLTEQLNLYLPITISFFSVSLLGGIFEKNKKEKVFQDLFKTSLLFLGSIVCLLVTRGGITLFFKKDEIVVITFKIIGIMGSILFVIGICFLLYYLVMYYTEKFN